MAKKIKHKKDASEEEEQKKAEEASRAAAGIQDEFQARGFELVHWMQERQKLVLSVIGAILVAGLAFGVYTAVRASRNADASEALQAALEAWEAPIGGATPNEDGEKAFPDATARTKAAKDLFTKAADGNPGTGAGAIAHLYAGHAALALGEHDEAAKRYQAFLDASSKREPLRFAGLAGLAQALEAKGDKKGALDKLEELINLPEKVDEDAALLDSARLSIELGDPKAARDALERITKDFPESSLRTRADEMLGALPAAGAPAEGSAPAAPEGDDGQPAESGKP
jgi:tetratricopeptide (TPR) repeat protein